MTARRREFELKARVTTLVAPAAFATLACVVLASPPLDAQKQTIVPAAVQQSDLRLRLDLVGRIPSTKNPTSPAVAGSNLLLLDQDGYLYRWEGDSAHALLTPKNLPAGIRLLGHEGILNIAADRQGSKVYVLFVSSSVPSGTPRRTPPRAPRYDNDGWYVLVGYNFDGNVLSDPRPIVAFPIRTDGHTGGGLVVLEDGSVLIAMGDNGDSWEDGRDYSQALDNHLSKITRVDPASGAIRIVAIGVRCVQRLALYGTGGDARIDFVDPGGWVSEELNSVAVDALLAPDAPVNFGWGRRSADKRSREGTFYIDQVGNSTARITEAEAGIHEPVAEFGREAATAVGVSGPVSSARSFTRITSLFGDLVSGSLYAATGPLSGTRQPVYRVQVVDATSTPVDLRKLAGADRADMRFFNFPDGTAGLLLEHTGSFYRLTEQ